MKLCKLMLAGTMVLTMAASSVVFAAEPTTEAPKEKDRLLDSLLSGDSSLGDLLSEENLNEMFSEENLNAMFSEENLNAMFSEENLNALFSEENLSGLFAEGGPLSGLLTEENLTSLLGEGGLLSQILPEGTDLGTMAEGLLSKLGDSDSEIGQAAGGLLSLVEQAGVSMDEETVSLLAGSLLGSLFGEESEEDALDSLAWDLLFLDVEARNEAITNWYAAYNEDKMEKGDEQIMDPGNLGEKESDTGELQIMEYCMQENFTVNDQKQMTLAGGVYDTILFTLKQKDDGSYEVIDAKMNQDGEAYASSIQEMCDVVGITLDEAFQNIDFMKENYPYTLYTYLQEHPDITGIEYMGEIKTADELYDIWMANLKEWSAKYGEEETEAASEKASE